MRDQRNTIKGNVEQVSFGANSTNVMRKTYGDRSFAELRQAMTELSEAIDVSPARHKDELRAAVAEIDDELRSGGDRRKIALRLESILTRAAEFATVVTAVESVEHILHLT